MRRVLLYSHDTFGLGHIRRTQKIAASLVSPQTSILIACASPVARAFTTPGVEYLNLPGFQKWPDGHYTPRGLQMPLDEFIELRASLLHSTVKNFKPDLLVIDKEPQGVGGELLPALEHLKTHQPASQIVCGFRDILDEKTAVSSEWAAKKTLSVLNDFFDTVMVYGDREIFDFGQEYELPESIRGKVVYTGYVQPERSPELEVPVINFTTKKPIVTLTLGGGGDGWEFLEMFLEMMRMKPDGLQFNAVVLTGPFVDPALLAQARGLAAHRGDLIVYEFVKNTEALFQMSDVVVSMGGYNTSTELAHLRKYPLVLPRVAPRKEQLIRAATFNNRQLCDYIHPVHLNALTLYHRILNHLETARPQAPEFKADGLHNIRQLLQERVIA